MKDERYVLASTSVYTTMLANGMDPETGTVLGLPVRHAPDLPDGRMAIIDPNAVKIYPKGTRS